MRLIRGLLFFIFSCVPGCGQMHQGYMKRGISQTVLTCGLLALAIFLQIGALAVLIVPLWLYSFFDSYNLRRQRMEGLAEEDAYLFGLSDLDSRRLTELLARRHSIIGWTLVLVGLYVLYDTVVRQVMRWVWDLFPWLDWLYDLLVWDAPRIIVTLLIIALGLWFIRGPRKRETEEIPAFVPDGAEEGPVYQSEFFQEAPHAPDVLNEAPETPETEVPASPGSPETPADPEREEDAHGNG